MRSSNTLPYEEKCPARKDAPSYAQRHKLIRIEGSDNKAPTKEDPDRMIRKDQCKYCGEIFTTEYFYL